MTGGKRLCGKYDANGALVGTELVPGDMVATGDAADLEAVADAVARTMEPAPRDALEMWIAELSVVAPSRADDEMTATLKLEAYARRLEAYPADMVRHVLLGKTWRFFPSWFELETELEPMRRDRQAMLVACRSRQHEIQRAPEEPRERCTPEAAAEIMARAGFGIRRFGGAE